MKILVAGATGALGRQLGPKAGRQGSRAVRHDSKGIQARASPQHGGDARGGGRARPRCRGDGGGRIRPRGNRSPAHRPLELDRHAPPRPRPRADQSPEDRRHRPPACGGARDRHQALRGQSFAGCPFARSGGRVKSEDDPLDPAPPHGMRRALEAIRHLEAAVTGAEWTTGIVLRYGGFYGPGTSIAPEGEHFELIRKRRSPVEDAADATVAAVEHGPAGSTTS
jgi:hypothetical protein